MKNFKFITFLTFALLLIVNFKTVSADNNQLNTSAIQNIEGMPTICYVDYTQYKDLINYSTVYWNMSELVLINECKSSTTLEIYSAELGSNEALAEYIVTDEKSLITINETLFDVLSLDEQMYILIHEFGHALGMIDTKYKGSVMYPDFTNELVDYEYDISILYNYLQEFDDQWKNLPSVQYICSGDSPNYYFEDAYGCGGLPLSPEAVEDADTPEIRLNLYANDYNNPYLTQKINTFNDSIRDNTVGLFKFFGGLVLIAIPDPHSTYIGIVLLIHDAYTIYDDLTNIDTEWKSVTFITSSGRIHSFYYVEYYQKDDKPEMVFTVRYDKPWGLIED
jgi:predicted metallopeptidase